MEFSNWFGVLAPAGTLPDVVQRLNREFNTLLRSAEVIDKLSKRRWISRSAPYVAAVRPCGDAP